MPITPPDVVHRAAEFALAVMTGNEVCVAAFVQPILRQQNEATQVLLAPRVAGRLGRVMPFWYAAALLLSAGDWWLHRGGPASTLIAAAVLLQFIILAMTLGLLVPRNNRLARMTTAYDGWKNDAASWDRLHQIRVVLLVLAAILLIAAPALCTVYQINGV